MSARFRNPNSSATSNPIVAVYEEIRSSDDDEDDTYGDGDPQDIPVAMNVVAVQDNNGHRHDQYNNARAHQHLRHEPSHHSHHKPQPWRHSNLIDLVIGGLLALCAFTTTIKIEITAFLIYGLAVAFNNVAEKACGRSTPLLIFRSIFLLLAGVFMFVDSVLLLVSVLVTEILGALALFLCALFGGTRSSTEWQQFIRRTCHLTRWGFRSCLVKANWKPDRIFPIPESVESSSFSGFQQQASTTDNNNNNMGEGEGDRQRPGEHPQASPRQQPRQQHSEQLRQYSDDYCARNDASYCFGDDHDEITMSTLTTTTTSSPTNVSATRVDRYDAEDAVIIPSDNVHVVIDDDHVLHHDLNVDDDDTDPFAKTSQRVVID